MHKTFRLIIFLIICTTVLTFGYAAFADVTFKLQVPLPDYPQSSIDLCTGSDSIECSGIAQYIKIVYEWLIRLAVVLGAAALVIAGLLWLTAAGDSKRVDTSKSVIKNTLIGLTLAFGSYALLWTINPKMVNLQGLQLGKKIKALEWPLSDCSKEDIEKLPKSPGISLTAFSHLTFSNHAKQALQQSGQVTQPLVDLLKEAESEGFNIKALIIAIDDGDWTIEHRAPSISADFYASRDELKRFQSHFQRKKMIASEIINDTGAKKYVPGFNGTYMLHIALLCHPSP